MKPEHLRALLHAVQSGDTEIDAAFDQLTGVEGDPLGFAEVDTDRLRRTGHPEVIFGQGKEANDMVAILERLSAAGQTGLVTRIDATKAATVCDALPDAIWYERARILHLPGPNGPMKPKTRGTIAIVCAGTSDLPVAEEAAIAVSYTHLTLPTKVTG